MKHLSEPKRRLVDVLSDYDEEKLGLLPVSSLKKCLHCHSIDLTSSEFRLVFDGYPQQQLRWWCCRFIQNDKVNYINFLKSWSDLSSEIDSPQSIKRASSGEDSGIGYTYVFTFFLSPQKPQTTFCSDPSRRRLAAVPGGVDSSSHPESFRERAAYLQGTGSLGQRVSAWSCWVFYATSRRLHAVAAPLSASALHVGARLDHAPRVPKVRVRSGVQRRFAASLTMDADRRLSEAFPGTFGRSTHISMSLGERSLSLA